MFKVQNTPKTKVLRQIAFHHSHQKINIYFDSKERLFWQFRSSQIVKKHNKSTSPSHWPITPSIAVAVAITVAVAIAVAVAVAVVTIVAINKKGRRVKHRKNLMGVLTN
jgi:hypothetical protein